MIKVNLLKNRGTSSEPTSNTQFEFTNASATADAFGGAGAQANPAAVLLKFGIILSLTLLLYIYESYNIGILTDQSNAAQARLQELQAEVARNQSVVGRALEMQEEIKQLETRIAAVKKLSRIRLREIKAVDYLQNTIPDRVWFQRLEFRDKNFRVEGFAATEESLNRFIEAVDGKSFFRTAILLNNEDVRTRTGTVKKFVISSDLIETD